MTSASNIKDRGLSEDQMRADLARKDRQGWFAIGSGHESYFLIGRRNGRNVALACSPEDRDAIILMARSFDALASAAAALTKACDSHSPMDLMNEIARVCEQARAALVLARGAVLLKTANETASIPGGLK